MTKPRRTREKSRCVIATTQEEYSVPSNKKICDVCNALSTRYGNVCYVTLNSIVISPYNKRPLSFYDCGGYPFMFYFGSKVTVKCSFGELDLWVNSASLQRDTYTAIKEQFCRLRGIQCNPDDVVCYPKKQNEAYFCDIVPKKNLRWFIITGNLFDGIPQAMVVGNKSIASILSIAEEAICYFNWKIGDREIFPQELFDPMFFTKLDYPEPHVVIQVTTKHAPVIIGSTPKHKIARVIPFQLGDVIGPSDVSYVLATGCALDFSAPLYTYMDVLWTIMKPNEYRMPLLVKTATGQTITLMVSPMNTVGYVKKMILGAEGNLPPSKLVCGGYPMEDEDMTLVDYRVCAGSTIQVVRKVVGG